MFSVMESMDTNQYYLKLRLAKSELLDTNSDDLGNCIMTFEDDRGLKFKIGVIGENAVCYRNVTEDQTADHVFYIAPGLTISDYIRERANNV